MIFAVVIAIAIQNVCEWVSGGNAMQIKHRNGWERWGVSPESEPPLSQPSPAFPCPLLPSLYAFLPPFVLLPPITVVFMRQDDCCKATVMTAIVVMASSTVLLCYCYICLLHTHTHTHTHTLLRVLERLCQHATHVRCCRSVAAIEGRNFLH